MLDEVRGAHFGSLIEAEFLDPHEILDYALCQSSHMGGVGCKAPSSLEAVACDIMKLLHVPVHVP